MADAQVVVGLDWCWIGAAMSAPLAAGLLVAWPIWRRGQPILGNIAGSVVIFGAAIGFIMREHASLDAVVRNCIEAGTTCWPSPAAFTRYAIYAFISLGEVISVFTTSIAVESRLRNRGYSPEWR